MPDGKGSVEILVTCGQTGLLEVSVGRKEGSNIKEEPAPDKSAFLCHLLGWSQPGPFI